MDISGETLSIIVTVITVGLASIGMTIRFLSEAAQDRRSFQAGMDDFRREMQRLAERQSNLEGRVGASAGD